MSFRSELRDYFERLAIRRVLSRTLGKGVGEFNAVSRWLESVYAEPFNPRESNRLKAVRREVEALCRAVAAPRKEAR